MKKNILLVIIVRNRTIISDGRHQLGYECIKDFSKNLVKSTH